MGAGQVVTGPLADHAVAPLRLGLVQRDVGALQESVHGLSRPGERHAHRHRHAPHLPLLGIGHAFTQALGLQQEISDEFLQDFASLVTNG